MLEEIKNLKDTLKDSQKDTPSLPIPDEIKGFHNGFYFKTNKLITALYMVTDIMDKEEPLRSKLRTLGVEVISDIYLIQQNHVGHIVLSDAQGRISQILSFLDISSAINLVSEMNCSILKKEFLELKQSIQESRQRQGSTLSGFFSENSKGHTPYMSVSSPHKGQIATRIGVQKGSTLLKALSKVEGMKAVSDKTFSNHSRDDFNTLKKQRRNEIINILKNNLEGMSIKDIMLALESSSFPLAEKTLQRELISMVKDNILGKTGEKRWSRYFLPARNA